MIDLSDIVPQMVSWRRQIHRHPETAYTEFKTAELVAKILIDAGLDVHQSIAITGVVGVLRAGSSSKSIALRADMDALDIQELNTFDYRSQVHGKMHACGHDGHTAMLLGAAVYLAEHKNFDGTIYFIFQPAEENSGGAKMMMDEGLFTRFPADSIYGMHNMPGLETGQFAICSGPMMAAYATFECQIKGKGTHSSMPETGINPITIANEICIKWQSYLDNAFRPDDSVNLTVTKFNAGHEFNVIPDEANIAGSTRCFSKAINNSLSKDMLAIAKAVCQSYNAQCNFIYNSVYPSLINTFAETSFSVDVAKRLVGEENVNANLNPINGSEDFAFYLEEQKGAYILIGNSSDSYGGCMVHNPHYDFNDEIMELGACYWISLAQSYLV